MRRFLYVFFICFGLFVPQVNAQVLDDDTTDGDEELFNEMFSDYSETEKDVTKIEDFGDIVERAGDVLKKVEAAKNDSSQVSNNDLPPIDGALSIGITKGSFKTYDGFHGEPTCSFGVTLKSTLNLDIKHLGLYLIYPKRSFAFMFFDVKANSGQEHFIETTGDICYNLTGVPDIEIHKCKIYGASNQECSQRLTWDENITAPEEPTILSF
jgi:hypothetical protein